MAPQSRTLSVDHLRRRDRFGYWREQWCEETVGVTGELARTETQGFSAQAVAWSAEHAIRLRCRTSPFQVSRGVTEISRHGWENWIWLHQERSDGAVFHHCDNKFEIQCGDILVIDPTIPFSCRPQTAHNYYRWLLPRGWIEPHVPLSRGPLSVQLSGSQGLNGLVRAYLHALSETMDTLNGAELPAVINSFCRLLAAACGGNAEQQCDAIKAAKLRQAKAYISHHLADPDLTPARTAAAIGVSTRQLHLLFEPTGTSFARCVLSQRLEECRAALNNPFNKRQSITNIAYAWGFNNLASFYRSFQRQFGVTPGEVRRG
jgi:AraC-like DNA-binding protein